MQQSKLTGSLIIAVAVALMAMIIAPAHANEAELKRIRDGLIGESKDRIVLFSAPWCALCKAAKFHFTTQKLAFQEINIEGGLESQVKFHAFGGGGVPLILVKGEQLRGFSIDAFEEIVNPEVDTPETVAQPVTPPPRKLAAKKVAGK